jgi:hypothetical protein
MAKLTAAQRKEVNELSQRASLLDAINEFLQAKGKGHFEVVSLKLQPAGAFPNKMHAGLAGGLCPHGYEMTEVTNANGTTTRKCMKVPVL